jgi:hypothetical protein
MHLFNRRINVVKCSLAMASEVVPGFLQMLPCVLEGPERSLHFGMRLGGRHKGFSHGSVHPRKSERKQQHKRAQPNDESALGHLFSSWVDLFQSSVKVDVALRPRYRFAAALLQRLFEFARQQIGLDLLFFSAAAEVSFALLRLLLEEFARAVEVIGFRPLGLGRSLVRNHTGQ